MKIYNNKIEQLDLDFLVKLKTKFFAKKSLMKHIFIEKNKRFFSTFAFSSKPMNKRHIALIISMLSLIPYFGFGQVRIYNTNRVYETVPEIDGLLNDSIWSLTEWSGDFTQKEPYENAPPSQQTEFKILYDDNHLYVAIRAFDTEPDKIERRLGRRGDLDGDWVAIGISSYYDKMTAFSFGVNAAGVKGDGMVTNDNDWDDSWQPVYYVKTSIDELGWVAEMKIPLNQLRFGNDKKKVWGLEVMRTLFRKEEFSIWQMVPQEASGWVSLWGELHGIENIKPKKEIALTPYIMGSLEKSEMEEGNPFETGTDWNYNAGLDGKIAVTNDLTLNFTINPDFGQVEADPSDVNLSAFESYFNEQRPFFIEGSNIFNYPLVAGQGWSRENLFYSRRIGRRPHYEPELEDNQFMDSPDFSRILGAFKLSGKTKNGWSIGIMESVTNLEYAEIDENGNRTKQAIEPMTNYFNTRIQKDFNKGKTIVGGMITATNRFINDSLLEFLPTSAYTGGLDFDHYWKDRAYNVKVNFVGSSINGTEESMIDRQEAPQRYYQRPDATHLSVDSSITQMSGFGGSAQIAKIGKGHWRFGLRGNFTTPGISLNDMGFMRRGDVVNQNAWGQYLIWEPFSIFRSMNFRLNQWIAWDFKGTMIYSGLGANFNTQFKNYWSVNVNVNKQGFDIDRHQLRGGPSLRTPGMFRTSISIETDERKKVVGSVFVMRGWGSDEWRDAFDIGFEVEYRPLPSLKLSVDPVFVFDRETMIYIETIEFDDQTRYLVSSMNSKMLQLNFRINYSVTPDLSFQYWGQPFFFSGDYHEYKKVVNAGSTDYYSQFHNYTSDEISFDVDNDEYSVDDNGNGNVDYTFNNPDFGFYEFRSNFVVRWEYIPGSTAFFVWSQGRNGDVGSGDFYLSDHLTNLVQAKPSNVFLLKLSYRLSF